MILQQIGLKSGLLAVALCACTTATAPEPVPARPQAQAASPQPPAEPAPVPIVPVVQSQPATATPHPTAPHAPAPAAPLQTLPSFESSGHAELDAWRDDFARRAVAQGHAPLIVYDVLAGAKPLDAYLPRTPDGGISSVASQAEFAKPIWDYLKTAVSTSRIDTGATRTAEEAAVFAEIEQRFAVDGEVVAAIWGMETSFGGYIGDFDGPETLINMATEGRRRSLAEAELLATMTVLERGLAEREQLIAGWAGAMGHTQFMPSTYLDYAVDLTGDGQADVWSSRADALGSAANYISQLGYRGDLPWGIEVALPEDLDLIYSDGRKLPVLQWQALGLKHIDGRVIDLPVAEAARLWLPADASGPKYLLFSNFDVFLKYNRSLSYAFAVGLLADGIAGRPGPQTPWPVQLEPVSVADMQALQTALNALGFEAGTPDGIMGSRTRTALQRFQSGQGLIADGYPTPALVSAVLAAAA